MNRREHIQSLAKEIEKISTSQQIGAGVYSLLRDGINLVFKNEASKIIARVSPVYVKRAFLENNLKTLGRLAERGAPLLEPLSSEVWSLGGGRHLNLLALCRGLPKG